MENKFYLSPAMFTEKETLILENGSMKAYTFAYSSGIQAVRVENEKGYFVVLPSQGQQVWRAEFLGKQLTMRTTFEKPVPTDDFLESYGCFYMHCGATAMGVPGPQDSHRPHGELPVAKYKNAWIVSGEDERGAYIAVSGEIFGIEISAKNYRFVPECRLYADETILNMTIQLENLEAEPFAYMYLGHINFRPVDGSELIYSAKCDSEHVKVHKIIGANVPKAVAEPLAAYMDALEKNPSLHNRIGGDNQYYDPEICFTVLYEGDENGMAHNMQKMPDGTAFYATHPIDALPYGVRWMSRTKDVDSVGMVLPATAEHLGYTRAKEKGQLKVLAPHSDVKFTVKMGLLDATETKAIEEKVKNLIK